MIFRRLSEYLKMLDETTLRNKMTEILAELFAEAKENEIGEICQLLQGRVAPLFEAIEFGIADKMIIRAIAQGLGVRNDDVTALFKKTGDLGLTAEELKKQKAKDPTSLKLRGASKNLSVKEVYEILYKLATSGGGGSQEIKIKLLADLLKDLDSLSARYVVRIPINRLRLGFSDMTQLDALSWYLTGSKSLRGKIEKAYNVRPDLRFISNTLKEKGIKGLAQVKPTVGTPILMARAERMTNGADILEKIGKCAVEPKYDGFRCIGGYTPLYIKDKGYISVRDVKEGDSVLTHKGRYKKILAKNVRVKDREEKIFKFQTYLSDQIKISQGHPVLTWNNGKKVWKNIETIKVGDYVVFPRPNLKEYSSNGKINPHLALTDESGYQKTIPANSAFYRFLGFWIGDGFTNEFHNTERVGLLFNLKTERVLADEYKRIITSVLSIPNVSESNWRGCLSIYFRDKPFRIWLSNFFRREWRGKMLPNWFVHLDKKPFLSFLQGWIESDGSPTHGGYKIITKERDLAAFVQLIALHHGILIGLHKIRAKIKKVNFTGTYYELVIPGTQRYGFVKDNYVVVKVKKNDVINTDPRMLLYNLQVEDDESYCTGLRALHNCQIHKDKDKVIIFSRNLERVTSMYPDLVEGIKNQIKEKAIIIEGEAVAYNPNTGEYLPFQETVQRRRKYDIEAKAKEIPLKLFAFDLLYFNGISFLGEPYVNRKKLLKKIVAYGETILFAQEEEVNEATRLEEIFQDSITRGLEGVMAKKLDGIYRAGSRDFTWIKYKRSYQGKIADTIDCVVMGYDFGQGKRTGFGIGDFLIGVLDSSREKFVTVAKIGTGLTDEEWKTIKLRSDKLKVKSKPFNFEADKMMECDVWMTPAIVVEIRADEITRSPVHTAGREMRPSKSGSAIEVKEAGYALRFPRLERFRDDRRPTDITTLKELKKLYELQIIK